MSKSNDPMSDAVRKQYVEMERQHTARMLNHKHEAFKNITEADDILNGGEPEKACAYALIALAHIMYEIKWPEVNE
jgi:hypothetical protein